MPCLQKLTSGCRARENKEASLSPPPLSCCSSSDGIKMILSFRGKKGVGCTHHAQRERKKNTYACFVDIESCGLQSGCVCICKMCSWYFRPCNQHKKGGLNSCYCGRTQKENNCILSLIYRQKKMKKFFATFLVKKLKRAQQRKRRQNSAECSTLGSLLFSSSLPLSSSLSLSTIVTAAPSDWYLPHESNTTSLSSSSSSSLIPQSPSSVLSAASSVAAYSNEYFKLPDGNYLVRLRTADCQLIESYIVEGHKI